jgi:hypothetical protein
MKKMHTIRKRFRGALFALALASFACSTTTFESTWHSPEARPVRLPGRKVVGVFIALNPAVRHRAEDAMAREISARGAEGVAAYTVLSDDEIKDQDASKAKLERLGFAGVVVMRVAGSEIRYVAEPAVAWTQPEYRHLWNGYWQWGWGRPDEPTARAADRIFKIETLVFSLEQNLLIWAGVSHTVDPDRVERLVADLARAVTEGMARDGLLGPAKPAA